MARTAAALMPTSPSSQPFPSLSRCNWYCSDGCCSMVCSGVWDDGIGLALRLHHCSTAICHCFSAPSGLLSMEELVQSTEQSLEPPWRPPWPPPFSPSSTYNNVSSSSPPHTPLTPRCHVQRKVSFYPLPFWSRVRVQILPLPGNYPVFTR